jgi:signal transduction histidine kinase
MALLEGQPRSATNVALDNARLLRVERERFQEWVATTPVIGLSIMATLSSRLRAADDMRASVIEDDRQLMQQVSRLRDEKEELLALQRVRQETSDLLVHDLRNPLSIIYGALNMLEMVLPEDSLRDNHDLLDLATSACERMQRLVDSMLDVAKFETGEMALTLSGVNLGPILENAAYQQAIMAQSRGITIEVYVPDDLSLALIDTEKIDRVLINLLDNALKYSPDEGQITVAAQQQGDYIVVSITDAGPGIPPHERERIFERFAQVPGDKPRRRGFGLGLTFCRLAVEAHGGQIWVEAGPEGVGSTFAFTLSLSPT